MNPRKLDMAIYAKRGVSRTNELLAVTLLISFRSSASPNVPAVKDLKSGQRHLLRPAQLYQQVHNWQAVLVHSIEFQASCWLRQDMLARAVLFPQIGRPRAAELRAQIVRLIYAFGP